MCCSVLQKHPVFWEYFRAKYIESTVNTKVFPTQLSCNFTFPSFPTACAECSRLKPKHQNKHQSIQHDKCCTWLINGSLLFFNLKICRAGSAFAAQQNEQLAPWKEARNKYLMACFFPMFYVQLLVPSIWRWWISKYQLLVLSLVAPNRYGMNMTFGWHHLFARVGREGITER